MPLNRASNSRSSGSQQEPHHGSSWQTATKYHCPPHPVAQSFCQLTYPTGSDMLHVPQHVLKGKRAIVGSPACYSYQVNPTKPLARWCRAWVVGLQVVVRSARVVERLQSVPSVMVLLALWIGIIFILRDHHEGTNEE